MKNAIVEVRENIPGKYGVYVVTKSDRDGAPVTVSMPVLAANKKIKELEASKATSTPKRRLF